MSIKKMFGFVSTPGFALGAVRELYYRTDDQSEDTAFIDYLATNTATTNNASRRRVNFAVDRQGSAPKLTWDYESWDWDTETWVSSPMELEIPPSAYWYWNVSDPTSSSVPSQPGLVDATGLWECDDYGRPFDLNDLLAP